jgi:hypothetical protein
MKIQTAAQRHSFANAILVVLALALASTTLKSCSGSDPGEIALSFASSIIVLFVAAVRFRTRRSDPTLREELWITGGWKLAVNLVDRLVPGEAAAPPAAPPPAAHTSASPDVTPLRSIKSDGVSRSTYDPAGGERSR